MNNWINGLTESLTEVTILILLLVVLYKVASQFIPKDTSGDKGRKYRNIAVLVYVFALLIIPFINNIASNEPKREIILEEYVPRTLDKAQDDIKDLGKNTMDPDASTKRLKKLRDEQKEGSDNDID